MEQQKISTYFDYNATTPVSDAAVMAMEANIRAFANASSPNRYGKANKQLIQQARHHIARLLGTETGNIFFTSGGSESNNWAIKHVLFQHLDKPGHIISTAIEHPSVLETLNYCVNTFGFRLTLLKPKADGAIAIDDFLASLQEDTQLVSVMWANNETGVIQPIKAIAEVTQTHQIPLHVDAVQIVGKREINVDSLGIDFLSFSAHKFYGPKGIGGLYVKETHDLSPLIHGGGQELGMRSGTENILAIAGLSAAAEEAAKWVNQWDTRYQEYKQYMMDLLKQSTLQIIFNGATDHKAAVNNTLNIEVSGIRGEALAVLMEQTQGFVISIGSACSNNKTKQLSHVLQAMGRSENAIQSSIRVSFGRFTCRDDIKRFVNALESCTNQLLRISMATAA